MSRTWIPLTDRSVIEYGGSSSHYFWDYPPNPGGYYDPNLGTYDLALPNCTVYALGRVLMVGDPAPIGPGFYSAANWHNHMINGWQAVPFVGHSDEIRPGDLLELTGSNNHVFVVEEVLETRYWRITESYYTDDNGGVSGYRSPAVWGSTKTSVNAYGLANYPYRYWHSRLYDCRTPNSPDLWPDYILLNPNSRDAGINFRFFANKKTIKRRISKHV